jgi:hypothetical protein
MFAVLGDSQEMQARPADDALVIRNLTSPLFVDGARLCVDLIENSKTAAGVHTTGTLGMRVFGQPHSRRRASFMGSYSCDQAGREREDSGVVRRPFS